VIRITAPAGAVADLWEQTNAPVTLIQKYNRPVPRYTSYPTVPHWQSEAPTQQQWIDALNQRLTGSRDIGLYVHLPFCEQLCTYCGCNKRITKNHGVEHPYVDAVLAELSLYQQALHLRPRLTELHLGGGTPTFLSPDALARLVDGITERVEVADAVSFSFEAHPHSTTDDHLKTLRQRGFNRISIGVQDFSPHIMKLINRRQTTEEVERTTYAARALGYSINYDLIYGLPGQRMEDTVETMQRVEALRPDRIAYYGYAHVPWFSPGQRAYSEADVPQGQARWDLYSRGRQMLESSGYHDIGLDHFALPEDELTTAQRAGRLHRNFMGYTTSQAAVTIALGCSAIGDCWDTYVQNEKKVEDYQRAVMDHRLPIVKGHSLTPTEQTVRRHILNLMCRGRTHWRPQALRCDAIDRAVNHWNEMAADGLLRRSPYAVEVTPAGRPFLRNICLPLDDHYWHRKPTVATFSNAL